MKRSILTFIFAGLLAVVGCIVSYDCAIADIFELGDIEVNKLINNNIGPNAEFTFIIEGNIQPGETQQTIGPDDTASWGGYVGEYYTITEILNPDWEIWDIKLAGNKIGEVFIDWDEPSISFQLLESYAAIDFENNYNSPTVPIPGAVWLLGSGLIGIVGLRKKLKK